MKEPRKPPPRKSPPSRPRKRRRSSTRSSRSLFPPAIRPPIRRPPPAGPNGRRRGVPRPASRRASAEARLAALRRWPDNERAIVAAIRLVTLGHIQAVDHRKSGPLAHLGDERLDSAGRAPNQRLDRAVRPVAHPARDAEPQRGATREFAIADALDMSRRPGRGEQWRQFPPWRLIIPSDHAARSVDDRPRQVRRRS